KLDCVGEQVPNNLLKPAGVARHETDLGIKRNLQANVLRVHRRPDCFYSRINDLIDSHRARFELELARNNPRDLQKVCDDLVERFGAALDGIDRAIFCFIVENALSQELRPTEYGIQRGAKFVRKSREKLVLHAVGLAKLSSAFLYGVLELCCVALEI